MPVRHIPPPAEEYQGLVQDLIRVLNENNPAGPLNDPLIIVEPVPLSQHQHVTVIWDSFAGIDPEVRGRIILNAITQAWGQEEMRRASLALGVTREGANRMGIRIN